MAHYKRKLDLVVEHDTNQTEEGMLSVSYKRGAHALLSCHCGYSQWGAADDGGKVSCPECGSNDEGNL